MPGGAPSMPSQGLENQAGVQERLRLGLVCRSAGQKHSVEIGRGMLLSELVGKRTPKTSGWVWYCTCCHGALAGGMHSGLECVSRPRSHAQERRELAGSTGHTKVTGPGGRVRFVAIHLGEPTPPLWAFLSSSHKRGGRPASRPAQFSLWAGVEEDPEAVDSLFKNSHVTI